MSDTISLGSIIQLSGFSAAGHSHLNIIRKIVGAFVRSLTDKKLQVENLTLILNQQEKAAITATIILPEKTLTEEAVNQNLFMAISEALRKLEAQL